jgi:hypothetical protein
MMIAMVPGAFVFFALHEQLGRQVAERLLRRTRYGGRKGKRAELRLRAALKARRPKK